MSARTALTRRRIRRQRRRGPALWARRGLEGLLAVWLTARWLARLLWRGARSAA